MGGGNAAALSDKHGKAYEATITEACKYCEV